MSDVRIFSVFGASLIPTSAANKQQAAVNTAEALKDCALVALVWADASLQSSQLALDKLCELARQIAESGHDFGLDASGTNTRLGIVLCGIDTAASIKLQQWLESQRLPVPVFLPAISVEAITRLRRASGLGIAMQLPEVILFDVATGLPVSTDAWQALQRSEELGPDNFPHWRSNVFVARTWPNNSSATAAPAATTGPSTAASGPLHQPIVGYHAKLAESSLLSARLYPGDCVLLRGLSIAAPAARSGSARRPASSGISLCVYVNAPPLEEGHDWTDSESDDDEEHDRQPVPQSPQPSADDIWLPAQVMADLGIIAGETVSLQPYLEAPTATEVTLAPEPIGSSTNASAAASTLPATTLEALYLRPYFGLAASTDAAVARASAILEGAAALDAGRDEEEVLQQAAALALAAGSASGPSSAASRGPSSGPSLSQPEVAALTRQIATASCRYVPLVTGQRIVVETPSISSGAQPSSPSQSVTFRVISTKPRHSAVIVGPETAVLCAEEAPR